MLPSNSKVNPAGYQRAFAAGMHASEHCVPSRLKLTQAWQAAETEAAAARQRGKRE